MWLVIHPILGILLSLHWRLDQGEVLHYIFQIHSIVADGPHCCAQSKHCKVAPRKPCHAAKSKGGQPQRAMDMKWAKNWLGLELFKSVKASSWWIRVGYISQLRWTSQTTGRHFVAVGPVEPWPACDLSRPHGDFGYQVWPKKKALSNKMSQEGLQHWDPCEAVWRLGGPVRFGSHHQRVIKWKPDIGGWFLQVLDLRMEIKHEFLYIYMHLHMYTYTK